MENQYKGKVLVVDDDPYVLESISILLKESGYSTHTCSSGKDGLSVVEQSAITPSVFASRPAVDGAAPESAPESAMFNAILTDIKMPGMSGVELLDHVHKRFPDVPVILMTAYAELEMAIDAIKRGAFDFIIKPYRYDQLFYSIEKAVRYEKLLRMEKDYKRNLEETVKQRTRELSDALVMVKNLSNDVIKRLTVTAEYRDTDTGYHIQRIGLYSEKLSEALGLDAEFIDDITFASPLHDIGKIGIPDSILLKPAPLTTEEFAIMKTHTTIGANMLSGSTFPKLKMAESIALNHHERWDGSGYPNGISGMDIPLEARIVIICDQYDALRGKRPYKNSLKHDEVMQIITQGDGRTVPAHFDPEVLKAFLKLDGSFDTIFNLHQD
ncbi:MAG: response regulator [Nitrospirae bacterium]|nr:response regulator [Nitrospirota bacterium]